MADIEIAQNDSSEFYYRLIHRVNGVLVSDYTDYSGTMTIVDLKGNERKRRDVNPDISTGFVFSVLPDDANGLLGDFIVTFEIRKSDLGVITFQKETKYTLKVGEQNV